MGTFFFANHLWWWLGDVYQHEPWWLEPNNKQLNKRMWRKGATSVIHCPGQVSKDDAVRRQIRGGVGQGPVHVVPSWPLRVHCSPISYGIPQWWKNLNLQLVYGKMISGRHYISLNQDAKLVTKSENNTTQTQKSSSSGVVRKLVTSLWPYDNNPMTLLIICPFAIGNFPMTIKLSF